MIAATINAKNAVIRTAPAAMSLIFANGMEVKIGKHINDIFKDCVDDFHDPNQKYRQQQPEPFHLI